MTNEQPEVRERLINLYFQPKHSIWQEEILNKYWSVWWLGKVD